MKFPSPASCFRPRAAIGIDIDHHRPIRVEASRHRGRIEFRTIAGPDVGTAPVSACLLQRESFVRWLSAPLASRSKAEKVFPSLLDIQLPFSVESCEFSMVDIRASGDRRATLGLVAGARHADIDARLTTLNHMGITPRILDQEGLALWTQLLEEFPAVTARDTASAIVYFASDRITLAVGRGHTFLGAHTAKEADPELIQRILKSYFPEPPPAFLWFWAGPGATSGDATRRLQSAPPPFSAGPAKQVRDPETFLARALAARALSAGPYRCNLLTGKFLHADDHARLKRHPYITATLCLIAGLALCITTLAWSIAARHRTAAMQEELRELAIAIAGSPRLVQDRQELTAAKRAIETQNKLYAPFMAPFTPPLTDTLKAVLAAANRNGLTLESMTMNRQTIIAHGLAPKWDLCEKTASSLSGSGWTATITRKDTVAGESRVAFVLRLTPANETH